MIKRLETHFLISVLLMIFSALNVSALIIDKRFTPELSAKKADLINKIFEDEKAKKLYAGFILCLKNNEQSACAVMVRTDLNRINDEEIIHSLKQLISLDRRRSVDSTFPSLTVGTLGFAVASLYCAFIIVSLRSDGKPS